jgi:hypothetical protein
MDLNDILYTPLDVDPKPEFDLGKLKIWLDNNYQSLSKYKNIIADSNYSAENTISGYPWNLTVAYWNLFNDNHHGWLGGFNNEFPELSKYLYRCFNLSIDDIGMIVFLPIKQDHKGFGFWHNDADWYGLRHYLCFDQPEKNKLLLKKTKKAFNERPNFDLPINESLHLQEETLECKILSPTQSFFLNNVRSVHSTYTEIPNVNRISAFVICKFGQRKSFIEKIEPLIIKSAEKYKDYAIMWDEEK